MNSMTDPGNARCYDTSPHAPHQTTFAPEVGIENGPCPGVPATAIADVVVREFARRAAALGFAINPDGDPTYLVERINTLLAEGVTPTPPESEWAELPACPAWCTGRHADDMQFRDCSSEETFVPQYRDGVLCVDVVTTFDRAQGISTPVLVRVEDYQVTPQYARHLAQLLIRAADLAEA